MPPSMRRAVGTRDGLEDGGPTVGTVGWDETSRCDGGGGCSAVIGYLLLVFWGALFHSRSAIFDHLRVLRGFAVNIFGWGEIGMSARDAPATGRPRSCERGYGSIRDLHRID